MDPYNEAVSALKDPKVRSIFQVLNTNIRNYEEFIHAQSGKKDFSFPSDFVISVKIPSWSLTLNTDTSPIDSDVYFLMQLRALDYLGPFKTQVKHPNLTPDDEDNQVLSSADEFDHPYVVARLKIENPEGIKELADIAADIFVNNPGSQDRQDGLLITILQSVRDATGDNDIVLTRETIKNVIDQLIKIINTIKSLQKRNILEIFSLNYDLIDIEANGLVKLDAKVKYKVDSPSLQEPTIKYRSLFLEVDPDLIKHRAFYPNLIGKVKGRPGKTGIHEFVPKKDKDTSFRILLKSMQNPTHIFTSTDMYELENPGRNIPAVIPHETKGRLKQQIKNLRGNFMNKGFFITKSNGYLLNP